MGEFANWVRFGVLLFSTVHAAVFNGLKAGEPRPTNEVFHNRAAGFSSTEGNRLISKGMVAILDNPVYAFSTVEVTWQISTHATV